MTIMCSKIYLHKDTATIKKKKTTLISNTVNKQIYKHFLGTYLNPFCGPYQKPNDPGDPLSQNLHMSVMGQLCIAYSEMRSSVDPPIESHGEKM